MMKIKKAISVLTLIFLHSSSAIAFIVNINSIGPQDNSLYNHGVAILHWDVNDATPNPCYERAGCEIASFPYNTNGMLLDFNVDNSFPAQTFKTLGELGKAYLLKYPLTTKTYKKYNSQYDCFHISSYITGNAFSARILPGSICIKANYDPASCFLSGDADISYGYISEKKLSGRVARTKITITCDRYVTAKIYARGMDSSYVKLREDGSLTASVMVNNQNAEKGVAVDVNIPNKPVPVSISATLHSLGDVEPGPFHGSGTIIVSTY